MTAAPGAAVRSRARPAASVHPGYTATSRLRATTRVRTWASHRGSEVGLIARMATIVVFGCDSYRFVAVRRDTCHDGGPGCRRFSPTRRPDPYRLRVFM